MVDGRETTAFNDLALVRVPGNGMTEVELAVEGHPFVRYSADALVVATPTGSTAYNFSAGGPIVSPRAEGILVTPAAPHSAFNRALFLSSGEKLALTMLPSAAVNWPWRRTGVLVGHLGPGAVVEIDGDPGRRPRGPAGPRRRSTNGPSGSSGSPVRSRQVRARDCRTVDSLNRNSSPGHLNTIKPARKTSECVEGPPQRPRGRP